MIDVGDALPLEGNCAGRNPATIRGGVEDEMGESLS